MPASNWNETEWQLRDAQTRARVLEAESFADARQAIVRHGRAVLKNYSTSFFIVTRFLPPNVRAQVDLIYAAVRYPDEVVDTFPLSAEKRVERLDKWRADFDRAVKCDSMQQALVEGVPVILAGFVQVMRESGIPAEYYRAFLDAMHADVNPRRYQTLDDLVENYIYGSATVVGYFLTYVYGSTTPEDFPRALKAARSLGIALQLTNFLRDVGEDKGRGRLYLPVDMLRARGVEDLEFETDESLHALSEVVRELAVIAGQHYEHARDNLDAFAPDSRLAIEACIRVYGELNDRVAVSHAPLARRESVPLSRKFSVLPFSKYWRLPLAYMGLEPA